ncbi:LysR family transcriptional regulator [Massilia atriviolacea]|uniref:LysR family transcriptional regulator n=1 Tax=Massilia atriviolacea TaxID=2495579 RepID=A0A430HF28_9BURK|nr:LysR family transcriptional regulator [Massilia atriviolacea]RSZ56102.1 LysR family transcriptional regulator [Massilia atriviolacea]
MDRLQSMRVFAKVVEQGSFARAAQALDMSNTVVTRNIADLEAHLGTRLLNRTTRKLSLTETGRQYLERVRQILADIDDADAIASSSARKASGTLRIYCHPGFGQYQLAKLLPLYAATVPDVVLDVTLADHAVDLVEEGFDVGIFMGLQKFDASLIARRLATSNVVLCASPEYVARRGEPLTPVDVSAHDCLNFAFEQLRHSWPVTWENKRVDVPISARLVSNNISVLRQAAFAGMGIMVRSSLTLEDDLTSGRLVQLLKGHHLGRLELSLVYPSRRLLSYKVRSFVDFMTARFPHPESDPWLAQV